jgi:hypothetical protein
MSARFSPIALDREFPAIVEAVKAAGHGGDIEWSESLGEPRDRDVFAREAIFVICNSGMHHAVAQKIYRRVMAKLEIGRPVGKAFGHPGKKAAIEHIWARRGHLLSRFRCCRSDEARLAFCAELPWIGPITKYHLAKNLGVDVAKPDVHLARLAIANGCSVDELCQRIAARSGLRVATVDVVLWRACAIGLIESRKAVAQ